ncbi:methylcobamide--CoM methyltransferase MtbA [Halochromatium roseum]|nr:methylcobamide--CoM methyltransferase MtbA [Halochromatium roseum]
MTSMQRVLTAVGHQEPDRVPLLLLPTLHGARELGVPIDTYFSDPALVAQGQLRMRQRYRHDCLYTFYYASIETEAWGGESIFRDDGPPNAGAPLISDLEAIQRLSPPRIEDAPGLRRVLETTRLLAAETGGEVPIIGVAIAPFSLPVMQLGFEAYLDLMHDRRDLFDRLMRLNEAFCVAWANAQVAAGAHAICYFDPLSSSSMVPPELFLETGHPIAQRVIQQIKAPVALHLASGEGLPIIDHLASTGAALLGVSCHEDLGQLKQASRGRIALFGHLNGIEMRHWSAEQAEQQVKAALAAAAPGGGFALADNHGEIPWQVPEEVLLAIAEANERWGRYPLDWCDEAARAEALRAGVPESDTAAETASAADTAGAADTDAAADTAGAANTDGDAGPLAVSAARSAARTDVP